MNSYPKTTHWTHLVPNDESAENIINPFFKIHVSHQLKKRTIFCSGKT